MARTHIAFGLTIVLVAVSFVLVRQLAATSAAGGPGQAAAMSFNVKAPPGACDDADKPTTCSIPLETTFMLSVAVNGLPVDPKTEQEAGYVAFQTQVFFGDLVYDPMADVSDEVVWPESALPVRLPAAPTGLEGIVAHGDVSGMAPPLVPSDHTGNVVEIALDCPAEPEILELALLPYDPVERPLGAGFKLLDEQTDELGQTVPAKTAGQREIDLDGQPGTPPEMVDVAATVQVICGSPAATGTSTPTNTPLDTPTPSPTATPLPPAAPKELVAIVVEDALLIQLLWQDNADDEESYVVERSTGGENGPWSVIASLPPDSSSHDDSGLEDGVTYWYRVAAASGAGMSEYSNVVSGTASALPKPPVGDVSCDEVVDAIDAALILQFNAGLIDALLCEKSADANEDGAINPVDAALILQYVAGLIPTLPP